MKRILPVIISVFFSSIALTQTVVPGGVVSGTWTQSGSPYLVQGNLLVANGATLTIQPGVTVNFQGSYKLLVSGRLLAAGTITDTIRFIVADTSVGWQGIRFDNTAATNDSSKITFCSIRNGFVTDINGGGIYINNFSKISISHSSIMNCTANRGRGGGIYMLSSDAIVSDNNISFNHAGAGAIYIGKGSPIIRNNYISYNDNVLPPDPINPPDYDLFGAGVVCRNSQATISNNIIINNNSESFGGGLVAIFGNQIIQDNNISNNHSQGHGGGVFCDQDLIFSNNNISNNTSGLSGGGIYYGGSPPLLRPAIFDRNTITNNTAVSSGGGMMCHTNELTVTNNNISNNSSMGGGGISFVACWTSMVVSNNIISNNYAVNGGAILCSSATPTLSNNTISNNSASNGGALNCVNSSPTLKNMLLWGNTASNAGAELFLYDDVSDPTITFSDVQGGTASIFANGDFYTGTYENNIDANPLFKAPSDGSGTGFNGALANWSLQSGSPCINTGEAGLNYPATDFAGNTRVVAGIIDIGALEAQANINLVKNKTLFLDKVDNVCLPSLNMSIRTKNISNIIGLQGTILWDTSVVKFNSIIYDNSPMNVAPADLNVSNTSKGYLTFSWSDNSLGGKTTADSAKIFTIKFDRKNLSGAYNTPVTFSSLYTGLEIDTINVLTGIPAVATETAFINGYAEFTAPATTVFTSLSGCDSIVYNNKAYYTSIHLKDTVKYAQSPCDSLYKVVDITVYSAITPTVSVSVNQNNILYGTNVTFTATPVNGGQAPLFQWFKNRILINGQSGATYSSAVLNANDTIQVNLKSSITCAMPGSVNSNKIGMLVDYVVSGSQKNPVGISIPNVTVNISGHVNSNLNAGLSGTFSTTLSGGYNYVLKANKNNDVNKTNGVSTLDVALIQSHTLNSNLFNSPYKFIAADVNKSGNVSALDILFIKRLILGLDNSFPGNRLWVFVDTSSANFNPYTPFLYKDSASLVGLRSNQPNQNFVGVKLGDVNFDWNAAMLRPQQPVTEPITLYFRDVRALEGVEIRVPIRVKNFKNVLGMQFTLNFNSAALAIKGIENNRLNIQYATNRSNEGKVPFIWNDGANRLSNLDDDDVLMELIFVAKGSFSEEDIKVTSDIAGVEAWDGLYNKHMIVKGTGKIMKQKDTLVYTAEDWHVTPNLTQGIINVNVQLVKARKVHFYLLDAAGKIVMSQIEQLPTGASNTRFDLQRNHRLAAGIYYLKVPEIGGNVTREIVLVK